MIAKTQMAVLGIDVRPSSPVLRTPSSFQDIPISPLLPLCHCSLSARLRGCCVSLLPTTLPFLSTHLTAEIHCHTYFGIYGKILAKQAVIYSK